VRERKRRRQSGSRRVSFADNLPAVSELEHPPSSSSPKKRALVDISSDSNNLAESEHPEQQQRGGVLKRGRRASLSSGRRTSLAAPEHASGMAEGSVNDWIGGSSRRKSAGAADVGAGLFERHPNLQDADAVANEYDEEQLQSEADLPGAFDPTPTSEMPDFTQLLTDDVAFHQHPSGNAKELESDKGSTASRPTTEVPDMSTLLREDEADVDAAASKGQHSNLEQLGLLNLSEEDRELTTSFQLSFHSHSNQYERGFMSCSHDQPISDELGARNANRSNKDDDDVVRQNWQHRLSEFETACNDDRTHAQRSVGDGQESEDTKADDRKEEINEAASGDATMGNQAEADSQHLPEDTGDEHGKVMSISGLAREARDSFDQKLSDVGGLSEMQQWGGIITPKHQLQQRRDLHEAHGAARSSEPEARSPASINAARNISSPESAASAGAGDANQILQCGVSQSERSTAQGTGLTSEMDCLGIAQHQHSHERRASQAPDIHDPRESGSLAEMNVTHVAQDELGTSTYHFVYGKSGTTANLLNQRFSGGEGNSEGRKQSFSPGIARQSAIEEELRKGARPSIAESPASRQSVGEYESAAWSDEPQEMPENRADDTVDHTKALPEDQPVDDDASLGGEPETAASAAHVPTAVRDADMTNAHVGAGELGDATFSGEHPTVGKEGQTSGKEDARDAEKDDEDEQHISHNHNSDPDQRSIRTTRLAEAAEQHSSWIAEGEASREPDLQEQAAADTQMQGLGYDKTERMHTELDRGEKDVPDDLPPLQESERETPGETHLSHDAHTNAEEQSDEHEDTSDLMAVTPLSDDKEPSWIANAQMGGSLIRSRSSDHESADPAHPTSSVAADASAEAVWTQQVDTEPALSNEAQNSTHQRRESADYRSEIGDLNLSTGVNGSGIEHSEGEIDHWEDKKARQTPRRQSSIAEALQRRMEDMSSTSVQQHVYRQGAEGLQSDLRCFGDGVQASQITLQALMDAAEVNFIGDANLPRLTTAHSLLAPVSHQGRFAPATDWHRLDAQQDQEEGEPSSDDEKLTLQMISCESTTNFDELVQLLRHEHSSASERAQQLKAQVEQNPPAQVKALIYGELSDEYRKSLKDSLKALKSRCKDEARERINEQRCELERALTSRLESWRDQLQRLDAALTDGKLDDAQARLEQVQQKLEQEADRQSQTSKRRMELDEELKALQSEHDKGQARLGFERSRQQAVARRREAAQANSRKLQPRLEGAREAAKSEPEQAQALKEFFATKADASRAIDNASLLRNVCSLISFPERPSNESVCLRTTNGFTVAQSQLSANVSVHAPSTESCFLSNDAIALSSLLCGLPSEVMPNRPGARDEQQAEQSLQREKVQLAIAAAGRASDIAEEVQLCLRRGVLSSVAIEEDQASISTQEFESGGNGESRLAALRFANHSNGLLATVRIKRGASPLGSSASSLYFGRLSIVSVRVADERADPHGDTKSSRSVKDRLWHAIVRVSKGFNRVERLCKAVNEALRADD